MQFPGQASPVVGVIYNTTMSRPDAALALAAIYGWEGKREARVGAVAVSGSGLGAAVFCDMVYRFYAGPGPLANANRVLPIGLAADRAMPPDPPMVKTALARQDAKGASQYPHSIEKVSDTSEVTAMIRNALTAQADGKAVVVLSAPATYLARVLDLLGTQELITAKVKNLIFCDVGGVQDVPAARKVLQNWPTPIVFCGKEVGEALPFPAESIEKDFAWSSAHPVVDAYQAFRAMPYDAPSSDLAAVYYAVHSEQPYFTLSEPGMVTVGDDGRVSFAKAAEGKHRSLVLNPDKQAELLQNYREIASAKPVPRRAFGKPTPKADPAKKPDPVTPGK